MRLQGQRVCGRMGVRGRLWGEEGGGRSLRVCGEVMRGRSLDTHSSIGDIQIQTTRCRLRRALSRSRGQRGRGSMRRTKRAFGIRLGLRLGGIPLIYHTHRRPNSIIPLKRCWPRDPGRLTGWEWECRHIHLHSAVSCRYRWGIRDRRLQYIWAWAQAARRPP